MAFGCRAVHRAAKGLYRLPLISSTSVDNARMVALTETPAQSGRAVNST
jgi:hypothetical protein